MFKILDSFAIFAWLIIVETMDQIISSMHQGQIWGLLAPLRPACFMGDNDQVISSLFSMDAKYG